MNIGFFYRENKIHRGSSTIASFRAVLSYRLSLVKRHANLVISSSQPCFNVYRSFWSRQVGGPLFIRGGQHAFPLTEQGRSFFPVRTSRPTIYLTTVDRGLHNILALGGKRGRVVIGPQSSVTSSTGFFASLRHDCIRPIHNSTFMFTQVILNR